MIIDIKTANHQELINEYAICQEQWGRLSSECFGFYIYALHKRIVQLGGWILKTTKPEEQK